MTVPTPAARSRSAARSWLAALLLCGGAVGPLAGCARYEFDVVGPPEFAQHVGTTEWGSAVREPIEYRFITVEGRLVVQVYNRAAGAIRLAGDRSVVVGPDGQSHPIQPQTIAPGSFVKLILPPLPPRLERTGPGVGFGVGIGLGSAGGRRSYDALGYDGLGYGGAGGLYDEPRYYAVIDPNDGAVWPWDGEGEARLTLPFGAADGTTFTHEFRLGRRKV